MPERPSAVVRPLTFELLKRLTHERFVSGEELAGQLGASRASISEAMKDAAMLGLDVFSLAGKGYRLASPLELIDMPLLVRLLGKTARRLDVDVVNTIDSTNRAMMERLAAGAPSGSCLVAEMQTAGRGRRGRSWQSSFGGSLAFTVGWRFEKAANELGGLSLAVGVAVARAVNAVVPTPVAQLKWPNDIIAGGKKLGGVLIESQGDMLGPMAVAIGIGLNLDLPDAMREGIDQSVTDVASLSSSSTAVSRNALLAAVLVQLVEVLDQFQREGFAPMLGEWTHLHALNGAAVRVHEGNGAWFDAHVRGVAEDGALIVMENGVERTVASGEVSVRARP